MRGLDKSTITVAVFAALFAIPQADAAISKMLPGAICQPSAGADLSKVSANAGAIINYSASNIYVTCPIVRANTGNGAIFERIEVMALPNTSCVVLVSDQSASLSASGWSTKSVASSKPFGAYKLTWLAGELGSNFPKNAITVECTLKAHPTNPGVSAGGGVKNIFYTEP